MLHIRRLSLVIFILPVLVVACILPTVTLQDSGTVSTAAAQTIIAEFVHVALSQTLPPTIQEPTLAFTSEPPTLPPISTFTTSPTPTATFVFFTPTPSIPQISVSVPTNCRVGPGRVYQRVGALLVGEIAEVYGRDPTGRYWYIRNPDLGSGYCWAWGEYATVTGNIALLPVYTPPPTPTPTFTPTPSPNFEAIYDGMEICAGWWVEIELENTGTVPFQSIGLTIRDTVTDVVLTSFTDGFTNYNGCSTENTRDTLDVGRTRVVSAPLFKYDPTGHRIRATVTLCSDTEQEGTCVTETIVFTP